MAPVWIASGQRRAVRSTEARHAIEREPDDRDVAAAAQRPDLGGGLDVEQRRARADRAGSRRGSSAETTRAGRDLDAAFDHRAAHGAARGRDALDRGAGPDHHAGRARRRLQRRGERAGTAHRLARRRQQVRHPGRPVPEQVPERSRRARTHEARLQRRRRERGLERVVVEVARRARRARSSAAGAAPPRGRRARSARQAPPKSNRSEARSASDRLGARAAARCRSGASAAVRLRRVCSNDRSAAASRAECRAMVASSSPDGIEVQALAGAEELERSAARLEQAQSVALELELGERSTDGSARARRTPRARESRDGSRRSRACRPRAARCSSTATASPARASRVAATRPLCPPPTTRTSKRSLMRSARMRAAASWPGAPITPPPG